MAKGRVQVPDLAAPDAIRPSPLQSDTFEAPAAPTINGDAERLTQSLSFFGAGVTSYINDPKRKKALEDQHLAEWETWKSARTNTQQLDQIRAGKLPYWSDPFIKEAVRKDYAGLEAEKMAGDIDNRIRDGQIPQFGQPTFDPDAYVVGEAKSYVDRLGGDASTMVHFGNNLDRIKSAVKAKHQEALGVTQTQHLDDMARTQLDTAITNGMTGGLDGPGITGGLRDIYKSLGPRAKGGSLDVKYGRLDDLVLDVLERKVQDPRYARQSLEVLSSDRAGIDGTTNIGSLRSVARHSDKIAAIETRAIKTLSDEAERNVKGAILSSDVAALTKNDGTFSTIMDFDHANPVDASKTIKVSDQNRKDAAVAGFIDGIRAQNGGQPNFDAEMDVMIKNGVKHPQFIPQLQSAFVGILNTNISKGIGPDQMTAIQKAGDLYNQIADRNFTYAETHLSKPAKEFYELYSTLTRYGGRTPEQAAAETARTFSSEENSVDPRVVAGRLETIRTKVGGMDFSWLPFTGGIAARGDVENRIIKLAGALTRAEGLDADTAIQSATDRVKAGSVYLNGRAVMAPGIMAGDEPHVQTILNSVFEQNKARFQELGIDSASHLSVAPLRNGIFHVVKWDGGAVTVPVRDKGTGEVSGIDTISIKASDIQHIREVTEKRTRAEAVRDAVKSNDDRLTREQMTLSPQNTVDKAAKYIYDAIADPWKVTPIDRK